MTIAGERQTQASLAALLAVFTCLPTGREVNDFLETSSPEMGLQQALDLWPLI